MENRPFEDVFPIKNRDIPLPCYFSRGKSRLLTELSCSPKMPWGDLGFSRVKGLRLGLRLGLVSEIVDFFGIVLKIFNFRRFFGYYRI